MPKLHLRLELLLSFLQFSHPVVLNRHISVRIPVNQPVPAAAGINMAHARALWAAYRPIENRGPDMRADSTASNLP